MEQVPNQAEGTTTRRSLLVTGATVGATVGAGAVGSGLLAKAEPALAHGRRGRLTHGDAAILRFLAAAEILETDLWQQYNELGGIQDGEVPGGAGARPTPLPLEALDDDMPQYIHDNTDDEISHFTFLNAYLTCEGRGSGQSGRVPHAAEQPGDRRPADRAADQPHAAHGGHQLVDAVPQRRRRTPTSATASRRPSRA